MKVKFVPQNIECDVKPGQSILHVAQENNIHIKSVCKGVPSCTECLVRVVEGGFNTLPPPPKEVMLIGNSYFVDGRRLSCQLKCFGDIVVDLTEQVEKEHQVSKRPRGGKNAYGEEASEESSAILGSLVLEENFDEFKDVVTEKASDNKRNDRSSHQDRQHQKNNRNDNRQTQGNRQNNRQGNNKQGQNRGNSQGSASNSNGQSGGGQSGSRGDRNRNRNRR